LKTISNAFPTQTIDILRDCTPNKRKKNSTISLTNGVLTYNQNTNVIVEKHFKCPVILFDYPANIKAFYMRLNEMENSSRHGHPFPGIGEIVGGSQRERFDVLVEK
jgi:asparaginyl-tRNA synthetase